MENLLSHLARRAILALLFFLPAERRRALERRLRGREQVRKLAQADVVIVSFGKSGRTWLRVMLSGFYQRVYGLSPRSLLGFDNFHRRNPAIPRIFFTHDNYIADYTGHRDSKEAFLGKKVVLLVRKPQDVAVSQYFQWKFRMRPSKKALNDYPAHGTEVPVYDFVMMPGAGLPKILDFMNLWAREIPRLGDVLLVRYEDMRSDPAASLRRIVEFMGGPAPEEAIQAAVEFASVENMRAMEEKRTFWMSGGRMTPRDRSNPHSFKVRRAKVGGYRDYFDADQAARIDELVRKELDPAFGYGEEEPVRPGSRVGAAAEGGGA
jgi:hypothetical protein